MYADRNFAPAPGLPKQAALAALVISRSTAGGGKAAGAGVGIGIGIGADAEVVPFIMDAAVAAAGAAVAAFEAVADATSGVGKSNFWRR